MVINYKFLHDMPMLNLSLGMAHLNYSENISVKYVAKRDHSKWIWDSILAYMWYGVLGPEINGRYIMILNITLRDWLNDLKKYRPR